MRIFFVVPDYFERRPKACMNGLGSIFLTMTPDGTALPCHAARMLPGLEFPNVQARASSEIWYESSGFNHFRGDDWMKEPCRSCPEKGRDFGGCRCQAYLLTGDAANADPVCDLSPHHHLVTEVVARAERPGCGRREASGISRRRPIRLPCFHEHLDPGYGADAMHWLTGLFIAALAAETTDTPLARVAADRRRARASRPRCPIYSPARSRSPTSSAPPTIRQRGRGWDDGPRCSRR